MSFWRFSGKIIQIFEFNKYIIDATGAFLTSDKCDAHDVDYVIITAPPKDNTSTFIYGANHKKYEHTGTHIQIHEIMKINETQSKSQHT